MTTETLISMLPAVEVASEAYDKYAQLPPEEILADVIMRGIDPVEFLTSLRKGNDAVQECLRDLEEEWLANPLPQSETAPLDSPWPWCEYCKSYHHPANLTCKANPHKDYNYE